MPYFKPGDDCGPEAELAAAMQTMNARIGGRLPIAPLAGAVGRIVVDYEHVDIGGVLKNLLDEPGKILDLVVRGRHDQRFAIGGACGHAKSWIGTVRWDRRILHARALRANGNSPAP